MLLTPPRAFLPRRLGAPVLHLSLQPLCFGAQLGHPGALPTLRNSGRRPGPVVSIHDPF